MMENIRTAANSIIVKIIFAIIIVAFVFTGIGGLFGGSSHSANDERLYIAKVDGQGLSRAQFENQVNQILDQNPALLDNISAIVRQNVLLSMIDNYLDDKLSETLKVTISDEQVKEVIRQQQVFFVDGVFNNDRFLNILKENGYSPDLYAESIRAGLQKNQLLSSLIFSDFSLPIESEISQLIDQKRIGYYANVKFTDLVDPTTINVTEDEIKNYYASNSQQFYHAERVKIKLLENQYDELVKQTKEPTQQAILKVYNDNQKEYMEPARYQFSLIPVNSGKNASQLVATINKEKSLNAVDKSSLIDLGWFTDGNVPDYLLNKLHQKNSATVVNVDNADYIAYLNDMQAAKKIPIDFVKDKIKQNLLVTSIAKKYEQTSEAMLNATKDSTTLDEMAKKSGLTVISPEGWQSRGDKSSVVSNPELQEVIFNEPLVNNGVATGNISSLIETGDPQGTYILQVLDYQPAGVASYDEVHEQIKTLLVKDKSNAAFSKALAQIVADFNHGKSNDKIKLTTKYGINRADTNANLNVATVNMIYSLIPPQMGHQIYGYEIHDDNSAVIAELTDAVNGATKDISRELINLNDNVNMISLNAYLRSKAKIELMLDSNL